VKGKPELCPGYVGRTARAEICAEAWELLKADYLRAERPSARACIARLQRVAARARLDAALDAHAAAAPRAAAARGEGDEARGHEGGEGALPGADPRHRRAARAADRQRRRLQAQPLGALPDGEIVRAKTWFWQDVYSRKILGWRIDKSEHTEHDPAPSATSGERYGIPHAVTIDNTLAAANKTMSGGVKHRFRFKVRDDEPDGVFKLLGVEVHWATPGHGQAKPIERAFGVGGIGEYVDKAPEFAGAWTGSSTQDKPEYDGRNKPVELAVLERVIAREVAALEREARPRTARTTAARSTRSSTSRTRARDPRATEAQRRLWLLSTEPVRAARATARSRSTPAASGRAPGEPLLDPALIDHAGKKLVAKFDPQRLHEGVHVYSLDGRYICFAACDRPAGFNDQPPPASATARATPWQRGVKPPRPPRCA
jgi:putative transposase